MRHPTTWSSRTLAPFRAVNVATWASLLLGSVMNPRRSKVIKSVSRTASYAFSGTAHQVFRIPWDSVAMPEPRIGNSRMPTGCHAASDRVVSAIDDRRL